MSPEGSRQVVDRYIKGLLDRNLDLQAEVCAPDMVQDFLSLVSAYEDGSTTGRLPKTTQGVCQKVRTVEWSAARTGGFWDQVSHSCESRGLVTSSHSLGRPSTQTA